VNKLVIALFALGNMLITVPALADEVTTQSLAKATGELGEVHNALESAYEQLAKKLKGVETAVLQEAQKQWAAYRTRNCELESARFKNRPRMERAVFNDCIVRVTKARTRELVSQFDDRKDD